jgi:hypothetical protein
MTFKTKLVLAVLASEQIGIEPHRVGVLYPATKSEITKLFVIFHYGDSAAIYADPEQEIEVSGAGVAVFKDTDGFEHEAEFEARGSLVPLREEHIAAVS